VSVDVSLLPARRTTGREALEDHATVCDRAAARVTSAGHVKVLREAADEARQALRMRAAGGSR